MESNLASPVSQLRGVGPAISQRLMKLGIHTVFQLLFHYPTGYQDYSIISTIADCVDKESTTLKVTLKVTVEKISSRKSWKRRGLGLTEAQVMDDTGTLKVMWFNQGYIADQLQPGTTVYLSGKVATNKYGTYLNNPIFERVKPDTTHTARIVPTYSLTHGITQKQLRYFVKQALHILDTNEGHALPDWIPLDIQDEYDLASLHSTLHKIHFPDNLDDIALAKRRLGFEELLIVQLFVLSTTAEIHQHPAEAIHGDQQQITKVINNLPFKLTTGQNMALTEILEDLNNAQPMNRLLEGDVGSGKTVIAALAMYYAHSAGYQSAMMAPTELLAQQHYETLRNVLPDNVRIALRTGSVKHNTESADIIVGTHALLQESVTFKKLGLAIIDEQHRFGVSQRQRLITMSGNVPGNANTMPHLLSMTATPIPRSLALTIYGDLRLSIVNELPAGRKPIITTLVNTTAARKHMYSEIQERITAGEQVYVVAPRILAEETTDEDTSDQESSDYKTNRKKIISIDEVFASLQSVFPTARMAELHGKLSAEEKKSIMKQFSDGDIDVLVATTVIEVGVDVPNATNIVIEGADRFGLAQLHQLRGRVGRSDTQSYCYVCAEETSVSASERLEMFTATTDGFALAEFDLERRGPGAVYGQTQSGYFNHFKMAKLTDHELVRDSQAAATTLFSELEHYPDVHTRLVEFTKRVHLE